MKPRGGSHFASQDQQVSCQAPGAVHVQFLCAMTGDATNASMFFQIRT